MNDQRYAVKNNAAHHSADGREIRRRHRNKQKARRLFMARVRAVFILVLTVVVISSVLLLTPLCDIRSVTVDGNSYVSAEEIQGLAGELVGTNLITASKKRIASKVKTNRYIKSVSVKKSLIPPTVGITVSEYTPAGYIQSGDTYYLLDENLYVIDDGADTTGLTCITGVNTDAVKVGETLTVSDNECETALKTFLAVAADDEVFKNVVSADFSDTADITFNYNDRLEADCGSYIDLEKKLRLFAATVKSSDMPDDARGTIDLSEVGNAVYLP